MTKGYGFMVIALLVVIWLESLWPIFILPMIANDAERIIGASLSKPHTSGTALRMCVCMFACLLACLLAAIYRKFLMSAVKF